jgi:hypothetical protein
VDPRAGLDDVEKRKFLTPPGLEHRPLGRPARIYFGSVAKARVLYDSLPQTKQLVKCNPSNTLLRFTKLPSYRVGWFKR